MLFTSLRFPVFVAVLLCLYYVLPKKTQWPLLLLGSLFFYWFSGKENLIFITVTAMTAFAAALLIEKVGKDVDVFIKENKPDKEKKKALKAKAKSKKWAILLTGLIIDIGILSVTKYTGFVIRNINAFLNEPSRIRMVDMIVPMGISFYTFQTCGYLIDVYRAKHAAQKNPFKFLLFVSFFPQLVQGPISRFSDLAETLYTPHKLSLDNISEGLTRVVWGYFKKLIVADRIISAVTTLIKDPSYQGSYVFVAMIFYAFELYCDFTGGIDITIGIARLFGIRLKENFDLPFFSKNIKEYWNRWHITMGTWFTDYIFYPVSVCNPMLKLSKWSRKHLGQKIGKRVPVYLASFLVWFTTGLWHGAAWNFIVWGLMNFAVIMISQELEPLYAAFNSRFKVKASRPYALFEIIRTFLLMSMIRMFDCYRDVPLTFKMLATMFTKPDLKIFWDGSLLKIGLSGKDYLLLFFAFLIILTASIIKAKRGYVFKSDSILPRYLVLASLTFMIVVFGAYGVGFDATQFIYNQF